MELHIQYIQQYIQNNNNIYIHEYDDIYNERKQNKERSKTTMKIKGETAISRIFFHKVKPK